MKTSPFIVYFAGVGTVVTALAVGFGGALFLTSTNTPAVKETPAMSAAKLERLRASKPEVTVVKADAAEEPKTAPSLLTVATQTPVDVKTPLPVPVAPATSATVAAQPIPPGANAPSSSPQQVAAIQSQASFEGPDNAVDVKLGDKPIAEPRKEGRSRRSQQRKTREIVAESRTGFDQGREPTVRTYQVLRQRRDTSDDYASRDDDGGQRFVTRTYEARSTGIGGLFGISDDD